MLKKSGLKCDEIVIEFKFWCEFERVLAQALWSWDLHGRARAESCAAVLPPLGDEEAGALEEL